MEQPLDVFTIKNSESVSLLAGESSSGKLKIDSVDVIDVKTADELFLESLMRSDPDKFTLIIYDGLVSGMNSKQILDHIEYVFEKITFDVFYLFKYADDSTTHTDFTEHNGVKFMKVSSAHGIDALILSPSGKDILKEKLRPVSGKGVDFSLNALGPVMNNYSSQPTFFEIDITKITEDSDYVKTVAYRNAFNKSKPPRLSKRNSTMLNTFWFILIVIVILIIAVYYSTNSTETDDKLQEPKFKDAGVDPIHTEDLYGENII